MKRTFSTTSVNFLVVFSTLYASRAKFSTKKLVRSRATQPSITWVCRFQCRPVDCRGVFGSEIGILGLRPS